MVEKAKIKVLETENNQPKTIEVMFNPVEYTVSRAVQESGTGVNSQFKVVATPDLKLSLFFDTYEAQTDVREKTKEIVSLTTPAIGTLARKRPPVCLFVWGGFEFQCRVTQVDQKFTMFRQDGVPLRAELTVTLKSSLTAAEEEKDKGQDNCRRLWTVKSGDRLDLIAYRTLQDPNRWSQIAQVNRIADPLAFPGEADLGRILVIPDYKELE